MENNKNVEVSNEELVKVKFLKKYEVVDENNKKTGEVMKKDDITEVPASVVKFLEEGKFAKVFIEEEEDEQESDVKSVDVTNARGIVMRTYTAEVHGKNFLALAKEFAEKKGLLIK